jgi:hypothetical protein
LLNKGEENSEEKRVGPGQMFCVTVYNEEMELLERTINGIF